MPKLRRRLILPLLLCGLCWPAPAPAREFSPERIGAFAGAMRYCEERHPASAARFRRARLSVGQEVAAMSRPERRRAMAARDRAFERGRFLGERLDAGSCRRLLRAGEWHRFAGN